MTSSGVRSPGERGNATMKPLSDPLLTVSQVRQRFSMSRTFVYYQIAKGRLRCIRSDRKVLIPLSAVVEFQKRTALFVTPDGKRFYDKPGSEPYGGERARMSIPVRLTPDERAAAERVANVCGVTLSDLCRTALGDAIAEYDEGASASLQRLGRRRAGDAMSKPNGGAGA